MPADVNQPLSLRRKYRKKMIILWKPQIGCEENKNSQPELKFIRHEYAFYRRFREREEIEEIEEIEIKTRMPYFKG